MFGFFLGLFDLGVFIHGLSKNEIVKNKSREEAVKKGRLIYYDSYGRAHLVSNGKRVTEDSKYIRDYKTGEIYIDKIALRKLEEKQKIKKEKEEHEEKINKKIQQARCMGEKYVEILDYNNKHKIYRTTDKKEFSYRPVTQYDHTNGFRSKMITKNYDDLLYGYYDKQFLYFCDINFLLYNRFSDENLEFQYKYHYLKTIEYNNELMKENNQYKFVEKNNIQIKPLSMDEFIVYVRRGNTI